MIWQRRCRIQGIDRIVSFGEIAQSSALVLLGDPGMGKSHSLELLASQARGAGQEVVLESLGALQRMEEIRRAVFLAEPLRRWMTGNHPLHLLLDGFDEALVATPNLGDLLVRELRSLPGLDRLRFRLSSRSLHWSRRAEDGLRDLFGGDLVVARLEPLDLADLREALNPALVATLVERGIPGWIRTPLVVRMLQQIWDRYGTLPQDEERLFTEGLRLLFSEHNELRSELHLVPSHPAERLEAMGERVAALTVLGGIAEVHLPQSGRLCAGGRGVLSPLDLPEYSADLVEETLSTKAFAYEGKTQDGFRLGWIHRTWAEELAARHLASLGLPVSVHLGIFEHPHDPDRGLAPPLAETARRLAARDPRWHSALVELDPVAALHSDGILEGSDRRRLVDVVLNGVARGHLLHRMWDLAPKMDRVIHDGLEEQLRPWLEQRPSGQAGRAAWVLAAGMAAKARLANLSGLILAQVRDPGSSEDLRVNGAYFFQFVPSGREGLRELALGSTSPPPSSRLQAACLLGLFPGVLTVDELGEVLRPTGAFARRAGSVEYRVLASRLIERFSAEEVRTALSWIDGPDRGDADAIYKDLLDRALELDDCELDRLIGALLGRQAARWHRSDLPPSLFELKPERRLSIAFAAAEHCDDWHVGPIGMGLVGYRDFDRLVDAVLSGGLPPTTTGALAWQSFAQDEPEHLDLALAHRQVLAVNPMFEGFFERWGYHRADILSAREAARQEEQARWQRQVASEEPPPLQPPAAERVAIRLGQLEEKDGRNQPVDIWWDLLLQLTLNNEGRHYGDVLNGSFADLPGWQAADEHLQARLLEGARKVLEMTRLDPSEWLGKRQYSVTPLALERAFEALSLRPALLDLLPDLVWERQAAVVVGEPMGTADRDWRRALRARVMASAPAAAALAVDTWLDNVEDEAGWIGAVERASRFWSPEMAAVLHRRLVRGGSEGGVAAVAGCLLDHGESLDETTWRMLGPDRVPLTVALLHREPSKVLEHLGSALQESAAWGRAVVMELARKIFPFDQWADRVGQEETLGLLVGLIMVVEPKIHEYSPSGSMGEKGFLWMLWNQILNSLVRRGTSRSVAVLEGFQEASWIEHSLSRARANLRSATWEPPSLDSLRSLLDQGRRRVESDRQLLDLVFEVLQAVEREDIRGKPDGKLRVLWTKSHGGWTPQPEEVLSLELKGHLARRLQGLVVDRCIQVRREQELSPRLGGQPGEKPDMVVSAEGAAPEPMVLIEVKPSWNEGLRETLPNQLGRYLEGHPSCQAGLLVVGWYDSEEWDQQDARRRNASRRNKAFRELLDSQAREVSAALGRDVRVLHLELGLERDLRGV